MKKYLSILFTLACVLCAAPANAESSWTAPTPTGSTLDTSTSYYLYNVGADAYFTNVHVLYTTEAGFGTYSKALTCTFTAVTEGEHSGSYNIGDSYATNDILFDDGNYLYVDGSTSKSDIYFNIAAVDGATDNSYSIYSVKRSAYIGYDGEHNYIAQTFSATTDNGTHWLLVPAELFDAEYNLYNLLVEAEAMGMTEDDEAYKSAGEAYTSETPSAETMNSAAEALKTAMLAIATPENAVDVTDDYIIDADFSDDNTAKAWTLDTGTNNSWQMQNNNTYTNGTASLTPWFAETWRNGAVLDDGGISQTVTLPAGEYLLKADCVATWQANGSTVPTGVSLYVTVDQETTSVAVQTTNEAPETYSVEFAVESDDTEVTIGYKVEKTNVNWAACDNFKLYYEGTVENYAKGELEQLIAEATELAALEYVGYETLNEAITTATSALESATSADDYATALTALQEAITAYKTANPSKFTDSFGDEITIINPDASIGTNEDGFGWTITNVAITSGQHWSGHSWRKYFEMSGDDYSSHTYWTETMTQDITLSEAGVYKLTAAGRSAEGVKMIMTAGEQQHVFPAVGDTGGTIDTDGNTWESVEEGLANGAAFANDNKGRGWSWGSIEVIVTAGEDGSIPALTIGAIFENTSGEQSKWASITDFKLEYLGEESVALDKDALSLAIEEASAVDVESNVGTDAFQRPQDKATAVTSAISSAQEVYDSDEATTEGIEEAIEALAAAVAEFLDAPLNDPADGDAFNIVMMSEASNYQGNALWVVRDDDTKSSQGYYNIEFDYAPSASIENQRFTFNAVEDKTNVYTISFNVDPSTVSGEDGDKATTRYICYAETYSGTSTETAGFRVTDNSSKACSFQVIATETDGIVKLFNPEQNYRVGTNGNNDSGLYTTSDDSYTDLSIVPASDEITWKLTEAGYGTLMLPFVPETIDIEGLTFYTTSAYDDNDSDDSDGQALELVKADEFAANTPYIVEGSEQTYTFEVTERAYVASVTSDDSWLTGVYATSSVPASSYVLQNQSAGVAFYIVEESDPITITPNHCYLTVTTSDSEAPAVVFFPGNSNATAITSVEAEQADAEAIYDLSGRKVSKPQQGIYIKGGKKVVIK